MKMAVTTTTHHSYTWCCVAQVSTALQEYSDPGQCARWEPTERDSFETIRERSSEELQLKIQRVTSPYPQLSTTSDLCGWFQDHGVDAELNHSNVYAA